LDPNDESVDYNKEEFTVNEVRLYDDDDKDNFNVELSYFNAELIKTKTFSSPLISTKAR
jgi:hypothetical protein